MALEYTLNYVTEEDKKELVECINGLTLEDSFVVFVCLKRNGKTSVRRLVQGNDWDSPIRVGLQETRRIPFVFREPVEDDL